MRILHVATLDRTVNSFLLSHIKALEAAGHEVEVACRIGDLGDVLASKGVRVHHISFERSPISLRHFSIFRQLRQLIKNGEYQVVHAHMPMVGLIARLAAYFEGVPIIVYTAHGFYFHEDGGRLSNFAYWVVERSLARVSTAIITINADDFRCASTWTERTGFPLVFQTMGVGIAVSDFNRAKQSVGGREIIDIRESIGIHENDCVIGTIGACTPRKRHADLLRAASLVLPNAPDTKILVIGDGKLLKSEMQLAEDLGIAKQCIFLGYRLDVVELLQCIDIYVQTSAMEGLPVSVMEAMASGIPVIGSNVRGTRDLVVPNVTGFLFDLGDTNQLAMYLYQLIQSKSVRQSMGKSAQQSAKTYDKQVITDHLIEIYSQLEKRLKIEVHQ